MTEKATDFSRTFVINTLSWNKTRGGWHLTCNFCQDNQVVYLSAAMHRKDGDLHKKMIVIHLADEQHKYNRTLNRLGDGK